MGFVTLDKLPREFHASHLAFLTKSSIPGFGALQGPSVAWKERETDLFKPLIKIQMIW